MNFIIAIVVCGKKRSAEFKFLRFTCIGLLAFMRSVFKRIFFFSSSDKNHYQNSEGLDFSISFSLV